VKKWDDATVNSDSMLLTVITPVFNDSRHIIETVDSVLSECSGMPFEYLVIDDGSTDRTAEILENYGSRINYVRKENGGQASAINLGFQLASGKYASIVNSDDPIPNCGLFKKSIEILENHSEIVCTYPDWSIINDNGKIVKTIQVLDYSIEEMYGNFNCLVGPGGVFRTELAKKVSGWDVSFKYVPDYDFWLKLAHFGQFKRIPQNLATWRQHPGSISVKSKNRNMAMERIRVISNHQFGVSTDRRLNREALANAYFSAATLNYFDSLVPGRKWALKSLVLSPKILFKKRLSLWIYLLASPISNWLLKAIEKLGIRPPMG
jgi:glycosyltransferase involved in cell wall biosynthesis